MTKEETTFCMALIPKTEHKRVKSSDVLGYKKLTSSIILEDQYKKLLNQKELIKK